MLPIVVLDKNIDERMASTVRHNRARGEHTITGMSNLIFNMLNDGMSDEDVCNELGLEPDELVRLKHITGFSKMSDKTRPEWQPTKDMWKVLKAWCDMDTKPTVKDRMEKAGVVRQYWWDWIRIPEFVKWWNEQTEDFMKTTISDLNRISYLKASSDFRYMELLQMKYGGYKRQNDVTSDGNKIDAGIFIVPPDDKT